MDENASIGNNVQIINKSGVKEADRFSDSEWSGPGRGWAAACAGLLAGDEGGRQVAAKDGLPERAGMQVC